MNESDTNVDPEISENYNVPGVFANVLTTITVMFTDYGESLKKMFKDQDVEHQRFSERFGARIDVFMDYMVNLKRQVDVLAVDLGKRFTGYGTECVEPFYLNLTTAESHDDWYEFTEAVLETGETKLFVRDCYKSIFAELCKQKGELVKSVITGTEGIGNSMFLIYLAIQLIQKKERVLLIHHPRCTLFDEYGNVVEYWEMADLPSRSCQDFWRDGMWILFDCIYKFERDLVQILGNRSNLVIAISPPRDIIQEFVYYQRPTICKIPKWGSHELTNKRAFDVIDMDTAGDTGS